MSHLALATSSKYPNLTTDDRLLLDPLSKQGLEPEPAIWNDPSYDWSSCAAVVIRSCWDYHLQPEKFLRWIAQLESANLPVFNPAPLVRWNANKSYLRDLEAKGIAIVPTFWPEDRGEFLLEDKLRDLGWSKAVVKPRISATAYRTELVTRENATAAQPLFDDLRRSSGVMLQKFMDAIATEGEWSLIFFAGLFSHAVLKKPQPGDFRVQNDFGGTAHLADPPSEVLATATHAINAVDRTIYARVDGLVDGGQFRLMELELIEPMLFLADHPQAPPHVCRRDIRRGSGTNHVGAAALGCPVERSSTRFSSPGIHLPEEH
jgi:glutathione synthase/RimK-type ligase-like ATP-grasp enzyme